MLAVSNQTMVRNARNLSQVETEDQRDRRRAIQRMKREQAVLRCAALKERQAALDKAHRLLNEEAQGVNVEMNKATECIPSNNKMSFLATVKRLNWMAMWFFVPFFLGYAVGAKTVDESIQFVKALIHAVVSLFGYMVFNHKGN